MLNGRTFLLPASLLIASIVAAQDPASQAALTDPRDGKTYPLVRIGGDLWMAHNLNYASPDSKCYENDPKQCLLLGRLYDWNAAKSSCPEKSHLPTDADWNALAAASGGDSAARSLKSHVGWNGGGNGIDALGMAILPAGLRHDYGVFDGIADYAYFWTATEAGSTLAWYRSLYHAYSDLDRGRIDKASGLSVRCVADSP